MDRNSKRGRVGNRNLPGKTANGRRNIRSGRRTALVNRRNRRQGIRRNRNRLARAENNLRTNRRGPQRRFRRFNNFRSRRNLRLRIVFVGGLPPDVGNRRLYTLFRKEGRIINRKVVYNRNGFSRGYGFIEFRNPRDAWLHSKISLKMVLPHLDIRDLMENLGHQCVILIKKNLLILFLTIVLIE